MLFASGLLTILVTIPFTVVGAGAGLVGWWIASTLASMLAAPYAAHALTVMYYGLVDPERPVLLEPGHRWKSMWDEQPQSQSPPGESAWTEYERKFDERWGK